MSAILRFVISAAGWWDDRELHRAADDPRRAQQECLATLLLRNKDTVFGRERGFAGIRDVASYRQCVRIQEHEALRPYIERMAQGERNVLTADPPVMFTTTSGTTGHPKLLPVTDATCRELSAVSRIWFRHASRDHPEMLNHRILTMVSPAVEGRTVCGLPVGTMSGLAYQRLPGLLRRRIAVPYTVMEIPDYDVRYFVALRLALQHPVSALFAANPSTFLRLAKLAEQEAKVLIRAIHDGRVGVAAPGLSSSVGQDHAARLASLEQRLTPDPSRARVLEACVARSGRLRLADAWPELRLLVCWLGGSGGFQAALLQEYYGNLPIRDPGYRASEATFTVSISDRTPAGILLLTTNFYEFIPEEAIDDPAPPVRLAHELEADQTYYVLVSTASGLYRYDINDIIRVEGFYRRAPLIAFLRKGRDMANITGEKLHVNHVLEAASAAQADAPLALVQLRVIPDLQASRYDVLVEPAMANIGNGEMQSFLEAFDKALCGLNIEYTQKRRSGRLLAPYLYRMAAGWSEAQQWAEIQSGRREGQYKWRTIAVQWDDHSRSQIVSEHRLSLSATANSQSGGAQS